MSWFSSLASRVAAPHDFFMRRSTTSDSLRPGMHMVRLSVRDTRHVSLARVLHARIYLNHEGRIFAVQGRVAPDKLKQTLARCDAQPTPANAPTPQDLGIAACDGELSQHLLHCIGRALNRWRKELTAETRRKPPKRRPTATLAREHQEIERLAARLANLRRWHAEIARATPPAGTPYFLDSAAEASLRAALKEAQRERPLTPLIAWQARIVYWLSGDCATRRFLSAVSALADAHPNASFCDHVRSFQQAVIVWRKRSQNERIHNLLKELGMHLQRLPPEVVRAGRLSRRLRGRSFQEHCHLIIHQCSQLLLDVERHHQQVFPAALAALAAADGSATPLPGLYFKRAIEEENHSGVLWMIQMLADEIGERGYDALLAALERRPELPLENITSLRQLLAKGNSLADSAWACEHALAYSLASSDLRVSAARRLNDMFASRGWPLADDDLGILVGHVRRKEDIKPVEAWLAWLGSVSPRALTPRIRGVLSATFWSRYLPSAQKPGWFAQLAPCLAAVRRGKAPADWEPLLDSIAACQRFAGKAEALPKSLRRLLESNQRRRRECESLRARLTAGILPQAAEVRLRRLECGPAIAIDTAKIRRAAEEAFLLSGLERLNIVTRQLALASCQANLGSLAARIEPLRTWEFAVWMDAMDDAGRECLRELIAGNERHGRNDKRHLKKNRDWLRRALARGVDLDRWLAAKPETIALGSRVMEIKLADDLRHIFLMGNYFHTCLSLGGCNNLSVLANAYDANKQVVFMFADDDSGRSQVVARQLIAVSDDFKLLGYHLYVNTHLIEKGRLWEAQAAMAAFGGRLAARCGLELAGQGRPGVIGGHFWYDDGACEWPAAARAAWTETGSPSISELTTHRPIALSS